MCGKFAGANPVRNFRLFVQKQGDFYISILLQEVSIGFICKIITRVNDAIVQRSLELAREKLLDQGSQDPGVPFCWMSLGSGGRQEQLLMTDQDNALIYANVDPGKEDTIKAWFLELAKETTTLLNTVGFEFCPADMMASNPEWCMSLSDWENQFTQWIATPTEKNVMFCTIFFDFRPVYGDHALTDALASHIFETLDQKSKFLTYLSKDALQNPPPLTFFRNFMVEKSGEHKDDFDIKARAMMPLADGGRVLILEAREPGVNNTFHRFDRMAELEPQNKELYQQAADAYELLLRLRALQGINNSDSGRYIDPSDLTKMERLNLRNCFVPIDDLQELLKVRFRVGLLM